MNTIFTRNIAFVLVVPLAVLAVASLCASPASAALVNHWMMDETSGLVADDAQDNRDGVLEPSGGGWTPAGGQIGGTLDFEVGLSQYIDVGAGTIPTSGNWTIMAWVNAESFASQNYILSQYYYTAGETARFGIMANGGEFAAYQNAASGGTVVKTGVAANTDQWYHVAFVKDGTTGTGYVDGASALSLTGMVDLGGSPDYKTQIGGREGGYTWDGMIDDVRFYGTALTATEIANIPGGTYPSTGPNNQWNLDETSGTVAADAQGSQDGTLVNYAITPPQWVPAGGKVDGALDFESGDSHQVNVGDDPLLGDTFTVTAWVKGESFATDDYELIFSQYSADSSDDGRFFLGVHHGNLMMYQGDGAGLLEGSALNPDQWYHMAFVKDGANGIAYLDGMSDITATNMENVNTTGLTVRIGTRISSGVPGKLWDGLIDDMRIYDTALSQSAIEDIMAGLEPVLHPGDADDNGTVDENDAAALAANWLQSGKFWADGDFNGDTIVDDKDAAIMAANWGWSGVAQVPEPSTIILLLGGILAVLMACRK